MSIFLPKKRLFLSFLLSALIFLLHLSCQLSRYPETEVNELKEL